MDHQLILNLKEFGLNEYEAKTYLTLTTNGPLTAALICEKSRVPLSKVYEITRSLIRKALVETWNKKPQMFKAVKPLYALKKLIENRNEKIEQLKLKSKLIISKIKTVENNGYNIWTASGKKAFLEKGVEMLERTKKNGFATTTKFSRCPPLDYALMKAVKKGVKVKLLGTSVLDKTSKLKAMWYKKIGVKIRILPLEVHPILGIGDENEVCIRVDNSDDSDFIWTNNPALINVMKTYFDGLWKSAKKF